MRTTRVAGDEKREGDGDRRGRTEAAATDGAPGRSTLAPGGFAPAPAPAAGEYLGAEGPSGAGTVARATVSAAKTATIIKVRRIVLVVVSAVEVECYSLIPSVISC